MGFFTKKKDEDKKEEIDKKSENIKVAEKKVKVKEQESKKSMKELYEEKEGNKKNIVKKDSKDKSNIKEGIKEDKKEIKKQSNAYKVLIRPLITEKINLLKEQDKYAFEVAKNTNKIEVAKAINEVYGVKPVSVNIINKIGKKVRRGRITGKCKDWKKAIITLPKGKNLNIYKT